MENAATLQAELDAMTRLHELVARLLLSPDLEAALHEVLIATIEITEGQMGNVQLVNESGALEIVAHRGFKRRFLEHFRIIGRSDGVACARALASKCRVVVEDVQVDPGFRPHLEVLAEAGCRALQSTPLLSRNGEVLGVLSTHYSQPYQPSDRDLRILDLYTHQATEVIEYHCREQTLRETEARLVATLESIRDGFFCLDAELRFNYVNDEAERICHMSREEMIGRHLFDIFPEASNSRLEREYRRAMNEQRPVEFENYFEPWQRWFVVKASPKADGGLSVFFHDVTDRKNYEERIRFQARLLDTIGQAVIVTTSDGTIIYWNEAAHQLYGWSKEEALGRNTMQMTVGPEAQPQAKRIMDRLHGGGSWSGEFRVQCKEGSKPVIATLTPVFDDGGELSAIIGVSVDISEIKATQQALKEADQRKNEFLATLGHELRNPLAAIRMATRMLQTADLEPKRITDMADVIDRQSDQLVRLIDDLLDVSRITRGKIGLRRKRVELTPIVVNAIEGVRPLAAAREIDLTPSFPARAIYLHGDSVRLGQVFGNLLHNACKYTPSGGAVRVWMQEENGEAVIGVQDTGVGIPRDQLRHVFEMFAQLDPHRDRAAGGLGIGLALAKRLIEMHGGTIEARSEGIGRGSEFLVRLPISHHVPDAAPKDDKALEVFVRAHLPAPKPRRILAVDDNRDTLHTLSEHLRANGHEVVSAINGEQALAEAKKHRPEILLLDIGLPGMDGYEVARRIRENPWGRNIRIIALTGWGQEEDKRRSEQAGINAHLTKPAELDQIERVVHEVAAAL